ncbi:Uncharacterised protein [Mycobacteroides abscessus subsp. massiliense]|uniref:Uncharacterized protein n=1 Tax=Mycobacteroides abscessus subsp. massiliense TaxID=1962118 RepID=A0A1T8VWR7_9MYCO|nr:Uncharacterised protein [Mycobacteroides abscessus subsp. massiliense]
MTSRPQFHVAIASATTGATTMADTVTWRTPVVIPTMVSRTESHISPISRYRHHRLTEVKSFTVRKVNIAPYRAKMKGRCSNGNCAAHSSIATPARNP